MRYFMFFAFVATIPLANFFIANIGTECIPEGPCVIPVGFHLVAPSGVLIIGMALVLRDAVHEAFGPKWAFVGIILGAGMSMFSPSLALASAAAFLLAETADLIVYSRLRRRKLWAAVVFSGVVGAILDSIIFVWLAFGSLDLGAGNAIGKIYASVIAALWVGARVTKSTHERARQ